MTYDPDAITITWILTAIIVAVAGKMFWDYYKLGRVKTGDYYMTIKSCEECRQNCCVNSIKATLSDHIKNESWNDSEVNTRLSNIEQSMREARENNDKMQVEVKGIRSALDTMAGAFQVYVKQSDARDRRTDELRGQS